ncbi:MAG: aspartate kinase [Candidatus Hydrogenedentes bacterium]|nr:aspartate kinase [Candidatus Hydrogenedentota bacterium]
MRKVTCKFGGTSLADAQNIRIMASIVQEDPARRFVVPSAPGKRFDGDKKVTDLLYAWHSIASQGLDASEPRRIIQERFETLASELGVEFDVAAQLDEIAGHADNENGADYMASRGEYLNGRLIALLLDAVFIDPADYIRFTNSGDFDPATYTLLGERLSGDGLFVIPGFYGARPDGKIKTFSRGGSDVTGSIVARATGSELYENWTDVPGFLMADPRIVEKPRRIDEVTYQELRELSYMGASVLHDEAIYPVREPGIPIQIRSTRERENPGTRIVAKRVSTHPLCGIAGKSGFSMISIEKALMNRERGFGRRVLTVLEEYGIGWEHMPTGIDTMSLIIRDEELGEAGEKLVEDIERRCVPDSICLTNGLAIIATVGQGMNHHVGVAARLFTALAEANVNVRVIDQGSSEMNIIVGVEEEALAPAVRAIYDAFITWD